MTAIAKSPEQLNAEAAASGAIRDAGPDTSYSPMGAMPPSLWCATHPHGVMVRDRHGNPHITACCLLHEARREWYYAHPDDLHVFRVPSDLESIPVVGEVLDAGELGGPPFAPPFVAYLQAPHEPIVRGLRQYRVKCAGQHAAWSEHRGRVVCAELLWSTVANGNPIDAAADALEVTLERANALLFDALRTVWSWRAQSTNGY